MPNNLWSFVFTGVVGVVAIASFLIAEYLVEEKKKKLMQRRSKRDTSEHIPELQRTNGTNRRKKAKSVISSVDSEFFCTVHDSDSYFSFDNESDYELAEEDSESNVLLTQDLNTIEQLLENETIDLQEILHKLKALSTCHSKNANIFWRLAQICQKLSDTTEDVDEKRKLVDQGIDFCKQGLEIKKDIHVHKWFAILYGSRALLQTTIKDKVGDSHLFKTHLDVALEYNPNDGLLLHLLGAYQFEIASLSWFEKKAASLMFPEFPSFSYDDALKSLLRAEELASEGEKENRLYIAKCYLGKYDKSNGLYWLRKSNEATLCRHKNTDKEIKDLLSNN